MARDKHAPEGQAGQPAIQDQILAEATNLFIRQGYNGVSFLGISKELGISHSHIHYYYRTKAVLAEAALAAYIEGATADFRAIWAAGDLDLLARFVRSRDWLYARYVSFNPDGSGGHNWGLLARFAGEAESISPSMRRMLRTTLDDMDGFIATGIDLALSTGELSPATPKHALVLQISSLLHTSRNITRFDASFARLDDLLRWTYEVIQRAYGTGGTAKAWPPATGRSRPRR